MLAKDVNDNAFFLNERVALETFVGTPPGASSLLQGPRANGDCVDLCRTGMEPLQEFIPAPLIRFLFE